MPLLGLLLAGAVGAFAGAQIDDKLDPIPEIKPEGVNFTRILVYTAAGLALYWGAQKVKLI